MSAHRQLGDVAGLVRGIAFPKEVKSLEPRPGHVACLRTSNVQRMVDWDDLWFVPEEHVRRPEQFVRGGDILISTANSYELVGKVAPVVGVPHRATLGAFISLIRPSEAIDPKFLYHQLAWGKTQGRIRDTASTTTNISNVSIKKLSALELWVPAISVQRQIVAEIEKQFSRLDEAVANLQRVKANMERYRRSTLEIAFAFQTPGSRPQERTLSEVAEAIVDCPHSTPRWTSTGYVCVRTTDFSPGLLNLSAPRYVSRETFDLRNSRLVPRGGDVLYSREGGILGIACLVPTDVPLCLGQRMLLIRPGSTADSRFIMHWLNSSYVLSRVRSLTGGSASPHLNVRDIRAFPIPLPPLADQRRIVAEVDRRLSIVSGVTAEVDANLKRAQALRQAVLARAFTGELVTAEKTVHSSAPELANAA